MNRSSCDASLFDDDVPAKLRLFIEVLLNGAYEHSPENTLPGFVWNVNERESKE